MSRLLDLKPDEEADVVNRVVMQIHRTVDDLTAEGAASGEQFRKTVFNQSEDTMVDRPKKTAPAPELSDPVRTTANPDQPPAPAVARDDIQLTGHAELEYSSMNAMGTGQPGLSSGRKLLLVASVVIVLSVVTAYMAYKLLDP